MHVHVDALSTERDSLQLQSRSLFLRSFTRKLGLATGADDAMPRKLVRQVRAQ